MKILTSVLVLALSVIVLGVVHAQQPAVPPSTSDQSATPATSAPPAPAAGRLLIDAGSLIGSVVRTPDGKDVGRVSALMIDPHDGRIASAVVTVGGVLGVGGSTVGVPWNALRIGQDKQKLVVTMEENTLERAPAASPASSGDSTKK
jgi:sporulation protein YlmC with PRC-barrel domain